MYHIRKIKSRKNGQGMTLVFTDGQGRKKKYECIRSINFLDDNMLYFRGKDKEYLLTGESIVEADRIVIHFAHRETYTLIRGKEHILYYENKEVFRINDAAVEVIAPKNDNEWIVSFGEKFVRYEYGDPVESFTISSFQVAKEERK
jgi:hypothetical protein